MSDLALEFMYYNTIINNQIKSNKEKDLRIIVMQWARIVERKLGLGMARNWKQFKVNLVEHYYGKNESKFFDNSFSERDIVEYCNRLLPKNIRYTLHKKNEACHSVSKIIENSDFKSIIQDFNFLEDGDIIKVFPESSNENTICFRRLFDFNEITFSYEIGFGQAYLVFENERGFHDTIGIEFRDKILIYYGHNSILLSRSKDLIKNWNDKMQLNSWRLCKYLGLPYISIEGYYDYTTNTISIVDIDLPFDYVFYR